MFFLWGNWFTIYSRCIHVHVLLLQLLHSTYCVSLDVEFCQSLNIFLCFGRSIFFIRIWFLQASQRRWEECHKTFEWHDYKLLWCHPKTRLWDSRSQTQCEFNMHESNPILIFRTIQLSLTNNTITCVSMCSRKYIIYLQSRYFNRKKVVRDNMIW